MYTLSPRTREAALCVISGGVLLPGPTMVIIKRRSMFKSKRDREKQHDFSRDKNRCAKCNMRLSVWDDPRVPCPGKPYSINTNRSLARTG